MFFLEVSGIDKTMFDYKIFDLIPFFESLVVEIDELEFDPFSSSHYKISNFFISLFIMT